jgi:hypothetical protein
VALALMTLMLGAQVVAVIWESIAVRRWYPNITNPELKKVLHYLGR